MVDSDVRSVFDSLVSITVREGNKVYFWRDWWIHGVSVEDIAPLIYARVDTDTENHKTI